MLKDFRYIIRYITEKGEVEQIVTPWYDGSGVTAEEVCSTGIKLAEQYNGTYELEYR